MGHGSHNPGDSHPAESGLWIAGHADKSWVLLVAHSGRFYDSVHHMPLSYARPGIGGKQPLAEAGYPRLMGALLLLLAGAWLAQAWTPHSCYHHCLGALIAAWIAKQLGVTGDTFRAVCESSETIYHHRSTSGELSNIQRKGEKPCN